MKILKERGITLVALVITIIVLLILAGVTLSLVLGDNGVVTKADEAKTTSNQKEIEEQVKLKVQENITAHEGEFDIEDFWTEIRKEGFNVDSTKKEVTKAGVTLSIGIKGEVAIVNEEYVAVVEEEEEDTYVSSPEEWFTTTENADGTLTITGFNENVVTKSVASGFNYTIYNCYNGDDQITEISIPKKIDGKTVKSLGSCNNASPMTYGWGYHTLKYSGIEKVIIPEGIYEIKNFCFWTFNNLTEITIPSSVEIIGGNAFSKQSSGCYGSIEKINVVGKSEAPSGWDENWYTGNDIEIIWNYSE